MISFPHPVMGGSGRGLLLLLSVERLRQQGWKAQVVKQQSSEAHDYLAVKIGPWLVVSVYVPCTRTRGPRYRDLALEIAALRTSPGQKVIVGGDFNWPDRLAEQQAAFYEVLGLVPLLYPPIYTRPSGPEGGSLLDNLYYPEELDLRLSYVGPLDVDPSPILEAYLDSSSGIISDHFLVTGSVALPCRHQARHSSRPATPESAPAVQRRVSYRRLQEWSSIVNGTKPSATDEDKRQAQAKLDAVREGVVQVCSLEITDLAEFRDRLTATLRSTLGTWRPRTGTRYAYLSRQEATSALRQRQQQLRRLDKVIRRRASAATIARHQHALNRAHRHLKKTQLSARAAAKLDGQLRCRAESDGGGGMRRIFKAFGQAKGRAKMVVDRHPHLKPVPTAAFWREHCKSRRGDVRTWGEICQGTIDITADHAMEAIKGMQRRAPGPDGMQFDVFSFFMAELAPALARCYTRVAREGLPAPLREALTLLGPKKGNERCTSANPADYRPITLLDMVVRIFHKILHNILSAEIERRSPQEGGLHRTQAGFRRRRRCDEQAFLLQLLQALRRENQAGPKKFFACVLLDVRKAFDSIEFEVVLEIMERRRYPAELREVLRKFLPGNFTSIMGQRIALERGCPQGGALSPDLCLLVMDDLADDLLKAIRADPELFRMWPTSCSTRGHEWRPPRDEPLLSLWTALLQFADNITFMGGSPRAINSFVNTAASWAQRTGLELNKDTQLALMSIQSRHDLDQLQCDQPLLVSGIQLRWQTREAFKLLGITCQTVYSNRRWAPTLPVDSTAVAKLLHVIEAPFSLGNGQHCVDPVALRLGVEQLLHASFLFQTPVVDVEYDVLQSKALSMVRRVMMLQPTTPTAYIQWEMRLWPPRLRAHKRKLMFAYHLVFHTWLGEQLLRPYLSSCASQDRETDDLHPVFELSPLRLLGDVLREYHMSWYDVYFQWRDVPYEARDLLAAKLEREALRPAFLRHLHHLAAEDTPESSGIPPHHRQQLLKTMALPPPESGQREASQLPLYMYISHDLPRAGMLFRAPYLRLQPRGLHVLRSDCAWCGEHEGEYGYHLIRCPRMPRSVLLLRNRAIRLQREDARSQAESLGEELDRLFHLSWEGRASWRPGRHDRRRQPAQEAIEASLIYMRQAINEYGLHQPAVWRLPEYKPASPVTPEEEVLLLATINAPAAAGAGQ